MPAGPFANLAAGFAHRFGGQPDFAVRAPGRVNLIGEHTDYTGGLVLPMAIDRELRLAARGRDDGRVRLVSSAFEGELAFALDEAASDTAMGRAWGAYATGVARALAEAGWMVGGIDGFIASEIPLGGGLSSSAALELAIARALIEVSGRGGWNAFEAARICQRAENVYVGSNCGLMDQLAVALGEDGCALLIDCRSLATRAVRLPASLAVVVCDSAVSRRLVESAYNQRRRECEAAASALGVESLRDASLEGLHAAGLPAPLDRRARHVLSENARVLRAVDALERGAADDLGQLMVQSHDSLRDDFEVSCRELDLLVEMARGLPGCFGSRLTGAGFGGCTVSLVAAERAGQFADELVARYRAATGLDGRAFMCRAVAGVSLLEDAVS